MLMNQKGSINPIAVAIIILAAFIGFGFVWSIIDPDPWTNKNKSEILTPINHTPMVGEVTNLGHYDLFCNKADLSQNKEGKQSGSCSFNYFYPVIGGDQLINQNITVKVDEHFKIGGQEWVFRGHHNGTFIFDKGEV